MEHNLLLQRIYDNGDSTCGSMLSLDTPKPHLEGWVLEDEFRATKLAKETRIPAGKYKLGIRKEITGLTQKYLDDDRLKPWFERHIEVLGVKGFMGIYIHIGNDEEHTDGCILIGDSLENINLVKAKPLGKSVQAYKRFYQKYYPLLKEGKTVYLTIFDEQKLLT